MSVAEALRDLSRFVGRCEDEGRVTDVGFAERGDRGEATTLTAEVELELSTRAGEERELRLHETTLDSEGRLRLGLGSTTPVAPGSDHDSGIDTGVVDATLGPDGTVAVTLSASVPVDGARSARGEPGGEAEAGAGGGADPILDGAAPATEPAEPPTAPHERDVPPFEDTELLAEVYESCDTFAEMTDELGMDVTAETVRRYMIDHGIHEPNSYDTGDRSGAPATGVEAEAGADDADAESPVVLADGIGLPEDVTVETLIETVKRSNTIFEVKQDVGVEREDALEMLKELNLLDLVVGRLATEAERDISREEVVERLRETSASATS